MPTRARASLVLVALAVAASCRRRRRARRRGRGAGRAAARAAAAARELVHAADAALRHPLLPRERGVRRAGRALRRARLPPQHPLPQLAAERPGEHHAHRHLRRRQRLGQLDPLQLHQRLRRPARFARRAERLRRLREAAHHARVHARRPPGHDPQPLPAGGATRCSAGPTRPTWRSRPGSSRGWRSCMESRQTTAGRLRSSFYDMHLRVPFLEGRAVRPRSDLRPSPTPTRRGRPPTSTARACSATSRTATARTRSARSRTATPTPASRAGSTGPRSQAVGRGYVGRLRRRPLRRLAPLDRPPLRAARPRRRRGGRSPPPRRLTWDAPVAAQRGAGRALLPRRHAGLPPQQQRPVARLRPPRSGDRARTASIADMQGGGPAAPTPDGQALIFQRLNFLPLAAAASRATRDLAWNDLFRLDVAQRHDPAADPRRCARTSPTSRPTASRSPACWWGPARGSWRWCRSRAARRASSCRARPGLAFTPAFSPDGRLIAYSRWKPGGFRDIHLYDLATATDRALSVDRAMDIDPRFSPDGRYVLFSSDRSGINDIYAYELATGRLFQVTNVLSGAFQPVGLARRPPAGLHRVHHRRVRPLDACPSIRPRSSRRKPFANARLDSPTDPDAETDSPDAAPEDAAAVPVPPARRPLRPLEVHVPATSGRLRCSPIRSGSGQTFQIQTGGRRSGRHPRLRLQPAGPAPAATPLGQRLLHLRPLLAGRSACRSPRSTLITNGLIVDNQNLNYTAAHGDLLARRPSLPVLRTAGRQRRHQLRLRLLRLRADQPDPGRRADGRHHHQARDRPRRRPEALLDFLQRAHAGSTRSATRRGATCSSTCASPTRRWAGGSRRRRSTGPGPSTLTPPWARLHALALITAGRLSRWATSASSSSLGGYGEQDVLRGVLLKQQPVRRSCAAIRPTSCPGDSYLVVSAEYRAPLALDRARLPDASRSTCGASGATRFFDAGNAFQGPFHAERAEDRRRPRGPPASSSWSTTSTPQITARLRARLPVGRRQPVLLRHRREFLRKGPWEGPLNPPRRAAPGKARRRSRDRLTHHGVDAVGEDRGHLVDLGGRSR